MSFFSISHRFYRTILLKRSSFLHGACLFTTDASPAQKFITHLHNNQSNVEKSLNRVKAKVDATCVTEVLRHTCSIHMPQLGLRFFVWAGLQPSCRHSTHIYSKAVNLLQISRKPGMIHGLIESYRAENCVVNVKLFKIVLNLCRECKDANLGLFVLRKMQEGFGIRPDTNTYNVVIRMFCDEGRLDEAMMLMTEMGGNGLFPDMITYISMVKGLCDVGKLEDACRLVKEMSGHGCLPNPVVYSALLDGVCRFGSSERALELLEEMEKQGGDCKPNVVTYTAVIQSFCKKGLFMEALGVLDRMKGFDCKPNRVTVNALITGLCNEGHVAEARKVIDRVASGGGVSYDECYSSLVTSLLRIGKVEEAVEVFTTMLDNGLKPDGLASTAVIKRRCLDGLVLDGFHLYGRIHNAGYAISIDSDIYSILLENLCQKNHMAEAVKFANMMVVRGIKLRIADSLFRHLKDCGEGELLSHIT